MTLLISGCGGPVYYQPAPVYYSPPVYIGPPVIIGPCCLYQHYYYAPQPYHYYYRGR